MTRLRSDHPFNTASPEIEGRAKAIAAERGHRDLEHEIVCHDGERGGIRVPVWQFYIAEAQLELLAVSRMLVSGADIARIDLPKIRPGEPGDTVNAK